MNEVSLETAVVYCRSQGLYPKLEEHDNKIREKVIDEFIAWLYQRKDISFHEKENMKEWFLLEQSDRENNNTEPYCLIAEKYCNSDRPCIECPDYKE